MKTLPATMLLVGMLSACFALNAQPLNEQPVRLSETYELANIILASTDYGKTDPWEVHQQSAYYRQVRVWFDRYAGHPLLKKVNYSRQQWENYLSFRTDAYAFNFDATGKLVRIHNFYANKGVNCFEENLTLITDFVKTTGFRQFYKAHKPYYAALARVYLKSQRYPEMIDFLTKEFGKKQEATRYAIVLSPLVGRMNCHREVASVQTDFITLPDFLLNGKAVNNATREEIASSTHMLFTELDHGFVNPLSEQYRHLLDSTFTADTWDRGSGYARDSLATFNEYMTWAVYDLFVQTYYPDVATRVCQNWAMQNETRGFYASSLVNRLVTDVYRQRRKGQTIYELYPDIIAQIGSRQSSLSQPIITGSNVDNRTIADTVVTVAIQFSESMQTLDTLDIIRINKSGDKNQIRPFAVSPLTWSTDGKQLSFTVQLVPGVVNQLVFNYPWKTRRLLTSTKVVNLSPYSSVTVNVAAIR